MNDLKERRKVAWEKYKASDKYKAELQRRKNARVFNKMFITGQADFRTPEQKRKDSQKKYLQSDKGKMAQYQSRIRYRQSEKGKVAIAKAQDKYFNSEKGKAAIARYESKTERLYQTVPFFRTRTGNSRRIPSSINKLADKFKGV